MTGDRKIRTPREKAHEALDVEARKLERARSRLTRLEAGLEPAEADVESLEERVRFLAQDPALDREAADELLEGLELIDADPDLLDEIDAGLAPVDDPANYPDDPELDVTEAPPVRP